jgi:uncharacterized membrane protein YesL
VIAGFRACWAGLRHLNHQGYVYIWANLAWMALSLPLVTAPAAWAGLVRLNYHAQRSPGAEFEHFWLGFREHLRHGIVLALINAVVIGINVTNLLAYRDAVGLQADSIRFVWILALVVWGAMQLYAFPLYYAMEQPSLPGAFRNAAVMIALNPLFTLEVLIVAALLIVVSTILPAAWLLLTGSVLAAVATSAVRNRLHAAGFGAEASALAVVSDEAFPESL